MRTNATSCLVSRLLQDSPSCDAFNVLFSGRRLQARADRSVLVAEAELPAVVLLVV
jgi:hypothetical protein